MAAKFLRKLLVVNKGCNNNKQFKRLLKEPSVNSAFYMFDEFLNP